jgi:hypothetical protein
MAGANQRQMQKQCKAATLNARMDKKGARRRKGKAERRLRKGRAKVKERQREATRELLTSAEHFRPFML